MLAEISEKRREQRLNYHWFVQFANSFEEPLSQGRMVDVSSDGAAFICMSNKACPYPGKLVATRFSVPCFESDKPFESATFTRIGRVCRVDKVNESLCRVAVRFAKPLPFKPGEQSISKYDRIYKMATKSDGLTAALAMQFNPEQNYKTTFEED